MVRQNSGSDPKAMGPWETDNQGRYAAEKRLVDPIFIIGLIPIIGLAYALLMIFFGLNSSSRSTGVPQQAIRSGFVGLVSQSFWITFLLLQ